MKHSNNPLILILAASLFFISGCNGNRSDLEGTWNINLKATLEKVQRYGGSPREMDQVKRNLSGNQLVVRSTEIEMSTKGDSVSIKIPYQYSGQVANCFNLDMKGMIHSYCLQNGDLEVHDPTTKLILVYSKKAG